MLRAGLLSTAIAVKQDLAPVGVFAPQGQAYKRPLRKGNLWTFGVRIGTFDVYM